MISHLSTFYIGFTCLCQTLWIFEADIWMFFCNLWCCHVVEKYYNLMRSKFHLVWPFKLIMCCPASHGIQIDLSKLLCSTQKVDVLLVGKIWTWFSALICATSSHLQNNLTTRWAVAETRVDSYCKNDLICSSFPEIHGVGNVGIFVQHNFWWK